MDSSERTDRKEVDSSAPPEYPAELSGAWASTFNTSTIATAAALPAGTPRLSNKLIALRYRVKIPKQIKTKYQCTVFGLKKKY